MKPVLRSVFHGLVGLLTWVVLTCVVCEVVGAATGIANDAPWTRFFFFLLAGFSKRYLTQLVA